LELPIDHFRLLGVSQTTDAQTVLHTLRQRLDRAPQEGFTNETLQIRDALLSSSADLLSDPERRSRYEAELTALGGSDPGLQAGLELPSSQEVAGLLLLLEAGSPLEVFELANRALQPPQAPALGSGREADLCLLAGLACRAGAEELRQQRHFERAAQLLSQGQQLLQRMAQQPQQRQQIGEMLQSLRPFRVLDLISRDLSATEARREGLHLLEELVEERGGLEGDGDPRFNAEEFQAFFRQIRAYLTVQEQIDLFDRWAAQAGPGASTADFLATTALTASGFAQRKPERIAAARDRLLASGQDDVGPLLACLHLLLGQVDAAEAAFRQGASAELQEWAHQAGPEPLAQLCAYCRDWLARDVLPGYRDLDADPDLEAYFADRDVQTYLNRLEARQPAPSAGFAAASVGQANDPSAMAWPPAPAERLGPAAGQNPGDEEEDLDLEPWGTGDWQEWLAPLLERLARWREHPLGQRPALLGAGLAALVLLAGLAALVIRPRPPVSPIPITPAERPAGSDAAPPAKPATAQPGATPSAPPKPAPPQPAAEVPLRSDSPAPAELRALLEAWLQAKATVLAGRNSAAPLAQLARENQVQRLEAERREDASRGQSQRIETSVSDLTVESRSAKRIAVLATISYSDQRLDAGGQPVGEATRIPALRNRYVFGRDQGTWRLVSFQRAD
jgi:hypothetical protein